MTQGCPHHPTRASGPNREPCGSSRRDRAVWERSHGAHSGAFLSTLTLGSPEGTPGGYSRRGASSDLGLYILMGRGVQSTSVPPRRLGQPQPSSPGSKGVSCRSGAPKGHNFDFYNP